MARNGASISRPKPVFCSTCGAAVELDGSLDGAVPGRMNGKGVLGRFCSSRCRDAVTAFYLLTDTGHQTLATTLLDLWRTHAGPEPSGVLEAVLLTEEKKTAADAALLAR